MRYLRISLMALTFAMPQVCDAICSRTALPPFGKRTLTDGDSDFEAIRTTTEFAKFL